MLHIQVAIGTDDVYKSAEVVNIVTQELGGKITRQPGPVPGLNTKITSFLDPDGWKTVRIFFLFKLYVVRVWLTFYFFYCIIMR